MTEVGVRALKQNASAVIAEVLRGETMTITDRGRRVAQLSPLAESRLEQLRASGHARAPKRSIRDLPAPKPGPELTSALLADRGDSRY